MSPLGRTFHLPKVQATLRHQTRSRMATKTRLVSLRPTCHSFTVTPGLLGKRNHAGMLNELSAMMEHNVCSFSFDSIGRVVALFHAKAELIIDNRFNTVD